MLSDSAKRVLYAAAADDDEKFFWYCSTLTLLILSSTLSLCHGFRNNFHFHLQFFLVQKNEMNTPPTLALFLSLAGTEEINVKILYSVQRFIHNVCIYVVSFFVWLLK